MKKRGKNLNKHNMQKI